MNYRAVTIYLLLFSAGLFPATEAGSVNGIIGTKHDLSKNGPPPYNAQDEDRICVFCHTPHNALSQTPLWNRDLSGQNYTPYVSSTMTATIEQPTGPSRLCLSCHDGTLALGNVRVPQGGITMQSPDLKITGYSNIGLSLEKSHPFSFEYSKSFPNPELSPFFPANLLFYNYEQIECTTCHDPHEDTYGKFLAVNSINSGLCILCHSNKTGWITGSHNTSDKQWNSTLPDPWPRTGAYFGWNTVSENGCENCHAPHSAGGTERLLNYASEVANCSGCHNGNVASKNIMAQFSAGFSKHTVGSPVWSGVHDPKETLPVSSASEHIECVDCHNPHASNNLASVSAPNVSGITSNVRGVDKTGVAKSPAQYEYEICFKCHAQTSAVTPYITRVIRPVNPTNTLEQFSQSNGMNSSHHPVTDLKTNGDAIPSLSPPTSTTVDPEAPEDLDAMSYIYCTDCHSDQVVLAGNILMSRGPHGSPYPPILRRQYVLDQRLAETTAFYNLCYRCHNRGKDGAGNITSMNGILNDASFRKNNASLRGGHSGHLNSIGGTPVNAPCAVCHDPHGVKDDGSSGSHTYLINFDTMPTYVSALAPETRPLFRDNGGHSGTCTLICHDANGQETRHDGSAKYTYGGGAVQFGW